MYMDVCHINLYRSYGPNDIRNKYRFLDGRVFGVATSEFKYKVFSLREVLAGNMTGSGVVG